jgi:cytochrome c biogenesis protein CcmG/thiol:disulfide interchange protein DsbE
MPDRDRSLPLPRTLRLARCAALLVVAAALACGSAARAAPVGAPAPGFALPAADGRVVSLAALRGQVVYVDFWASWCGPCRRSFPWMNALQQRFGARGLAIVAVNVDRRRSDAERFLRDLPAAFTVVFDPAGTTPAAYDVLGMPTSYLLDADGRIVEVEQGFHDERRAALEARIEALLRAR